MTAVALLPQRHRPPRTRRTELHRLLRKRDHLADQVTAHRNHGLSTTTLWVALVDLEDYIRDFSPRAYSAHLPAWLQRQAPGTHATGAHHPDCPLCTPDAPQRCTKTQDER